MWKCLLAGHSQAQQNDDNCPLTPSQTSTSRTSSQRGSTSRARERSVLGIDGAITVWRVEARHGEARGAETRDAGRRSVRRRQETDADAGRNETQERRVSCWLQTVWHWCAWRRRDQQRRRCTVDVQRAALVQRDQREATNARYVRDNEATVMSHGE